MPVELVRGELEELRQRPDGMRELRAARLAVVVALRRRRTFRHGAGAACGRSSYMQALFFRYFASVMLVTKFVTNMKNGLCP